MNEILTVALVAPMTGIASLVIGIIARSIRVALGCGVSSVMIIGGVALALFLWRLF